MYGKQYLDTYANAVQSGRFTLPLKDAFAAGHRGQMLTLRRDGQIARRHITCEREDEAAHRMYSWPSMQSARQRKHKHST